MKTFQITSLLVAIIACASAFSTPQSTRPAFKAPAVMPAADAKVMTPNAAAVAAFATAMAPLAANAAVDEGVIIGYGAGLVACVVSLAVGFSIGYGTLVKP
eukprot:CAMPEP_0198249604 /NCGR_PEP_ID=MMETSP1447-20131203/1082_1 /TAXON_ID=420782 /ORGANISM="Chaetoceros dichaeta, Strain CCMP1751" /LENGTH=100 /DNA_ID=CAMNT_0043934281 /DNA_START=88 /DNA_END=390 /DNA_ORIENTATION=-